MTPRRRWTAAILACLAIPVAGCVQTAPAVEALDAFVYAPLPEEPVTLNNLTSTGLSVRDPDLPVEHFNLTIASFDGTPLAADVWRPAIPGRFPVIVIISPYFEEAKNPANNNTPGPGLYRDVIGEFVPRGYAVALVDLRGTRHSDGCMDLAGPNERRDAYEVVEFFGTRNWSNGRVGMIGVSYDGLTQQLAAVMDPPHLAAIVPIAPVADWYHVMGKGGAKFQGWTPNTPYLYNFVIGMGLPPASPPDPSTEPDPQDPPVPEAPNQYQQERLDDQDCAVVNQVGADDPTGDYNAWMRARDLRPMAANATAPMYYAHGFVDLNARPDHIDPWYANYGGPKRAFLWQAAHAQPEPALTGRGDYWWKTVIQWFDHHLLGLENGVNATYGRVEVQDSLGRWRYEATWPPADATRLTIPLAPGRLGLGNATAAPAGDGAAGAAGDAARALGVPVLPAAGAAASEAWRDNPLAEGGTLGNRSADIGKGSTATRLVYQSPPLAEDLHYAGRPVVRATVESDRANTLLVARLYEVLPDGTWVLVNRGAHSLRHRAGVDAPQAYTPGEVVTVEAAMQPQDFVFRKGRAVGLTITSSDATYVLPVSHGATNRIHYGDGTGDGGSALVLPTIQRDAFQFTTWGVDQPAWLGPRIPPEVAS